MLMAVLSMVVIPLSAEGLPDAGPVPSVSVSLEPGQAVAEVTQTEGDEVTLNGTVEIDQPLVLTSELTLETVANTGWPTEVKPNSTTVTGPATVQFNVVVEVPADTSSLLTGNVFVTISLKAPALAPIEVRASAVVTVDQFFKILLTSPEPLAHVKRGTTDRIELSIYNNGNGMDTLSLELIGAPDGIRMTLATNQVTVFNGEYATVGIEVMASEDAPKGSSTVLVRATSVTSGGEFTTQLPVYVYVDTVFNQAPWPHVPVVLMALVIAALAVHRR